MHRAQLTAVPPGWSRLFYRRHAHGSNSSLFPVIKVDFAKVSPPSIQQNNKRFETRVDGRMLWPSSSNPK